MIILINKKMTIANSDSLHRGLQPLRLPLIVEVAPIGQATQSMEFKLEIMTTLI